MPVRSLSSPVLRWPDARAVTDSLRRWVQGVLILHPETRRVGYFGSYARGDWGVGSDLDLIVVVAQSDEPFERRAARWDTMPIAVPTDLLVYTADEWERLQRQGRLSIRIRRELVWMYPEPVTAPPPSPRPAETSVSVTTEAARRDYGLEL